MNTTAASPSIRVSLEPGSPDHNIFQWFTEYHFLQPSHLRRLSGRNIVAVRRRLRQLLAADYLRRSKLPIPCERSCEWVYYLGPAGIALAKDLGLADEDWQYLSEKSDMILPHDIEITRFHLCLSLTAQHSHIQLLDWKQRRGELKDSFEHKQQQWSIIPDAMFAVRDTTKPEHQSTYYYFVEVNRSREHSYQSGESAFVRKMRGYDAYWQSRQYAKTWKIPPQAGFLVLTIVPTRERALNLCEKMDQVDLNFRRYRFTHAGAYALDEPHRVLQSICYTPKDYEQERLWTLLE